MTNTNQKPLKKTPSQLMKCVIAVVLVGSMGALVWKNINTTTPELKKEIVTQTKTPVIVELKLENTENTPAKESILPQEEPQKTPYTKPKEGENDVLAAQFAQATLQLTKGQDQAVVKMGQMIGLVYTSFQQGGARVRDIANTAYKMAEALQDKPLAQAIANLRHNTPRYGPTTQAELLLYVADALQMGVPANAVTIQEKEAEQSSWWRRKISELVSVYKTENITIDAWTHAIKAVQLHIARGNITDAKIELNKAPLKEDARLNSLRAVVDLFVAENGKMKAVLTLYIKNYLE